MRFRKTLKVGPVRLTLTDKGLGTSIGAGPVRVGKGATGRKTASVASHGLEHRESLGKSEPVVSPLAGGIMFVFVAILRKLFGGR